MVSKSRLPLRADYSRSALQRTDTGQEVRCRPRVLDVVSVLLSVAPAFASRDRLIIGLTGMGQEIEDKSVEVYLSHARRPLALLGFEIVNQARVGWRLEQRGEVGIEVHLPSEMRSVLSRMATEANTSIDEVVRRQLVPLMENGR